MAGVPQGPVDGLSSKVSSFLHGGSIENSSRFDPDTNAMKPSSPQPEPTPDRDTPGFRIREYQPGDEIEINAAFNRVFGLERSLEEWKWKFGAQGERGRILVAVDESGKVHAHYAATLIRLWFEGREMTGGQAVDSFSSREREVVRSRLFVRVLERFHQKFGASGDLSYMFGFPGVRAKRLNSAIGLVRAWMPVSVWTDPEKAQRSPAKISQWRVSTKWSPDEVDNLWSVAKSRHAFSAVRDSEWLIRRYCKHPTLSESYRHLFVRSRGRFGRGRLAAWGVFRETSDGLLWVDLEWDGVDESALDAIYRHAVAGGPFRRRRRCSLWLDEDRQVEDWLRKSNWTRQDWPGGLWFIYCRYPPLSFGDDVGMSFRRMAGDTDIA